MKDAAAIKATFATYRQVAGRKVLQLILEVPIEAQAETFAALGYPVPDETIWVGVARMHEPKVIEHVADKPVEEHKPKSLAQIAGMLCNLQAFRTWLSEKEGVPVIGTDAAADIVRRHCGVKSRTELDTNDLAARRFKDLRTDYNNAMRGVAA